MNNIDKSYQALLQDILENGVEKETRNGKTLSVFGRQIRYKFKDGKFPLLTTKKMYFKGIVTELLWFLRGETHIKYLVDNGCHIWDGDCYQAYLKYAGNKPLTKEEFINRIKTDSDFCGVYGNLGPIYGKQWRAWTKNKMYLSTDGSYEKIYDEADQTVIDQIAIAINLLKTDPDSRRNIVSAWAVHDLPDMVLPPCHMMFQFYTRELSEEERMKLAGYEDVYGIGQNIIREKVEQDDTIPRRAISLMWNQRSVDTFLGLPFNIASYGLLLEIIAKEVNMIPDELIGNLGDTHLYLNHLEQAKEQIGREPMVLPKVMIMGDLSKENFKVPIDELELKHFKLIEYQSHPSIKAQLSN